MKTNILLEFFSHVVVCEIRWIKYADPSYFTVIVHFDWLFDFD